jgi:hypothetical protein
LVTLLIPAAGADVLQLRAQTLRSLAAPEADQGVAVDEQHFYAVDNTVIAKYERDSGDLVKRWVSQLRPGVGHLNSCYARSQRLWCANSNYPQLPHASSVEVFDAESLRPLVSHSLGAMDAGSLVWFDALAEGFIAGFAHYGKRGGVPYKDSRYSALVRFDVQWRRTGGWIFPAALVDRLSPYAASGGALGPGGYLYIMGHDRPEMYVLDKPEMGPELEHVATIRIEAQGQAFAFDPVHPDRVWVIDRHAGLVREVVLPALPGPARGF